jgi:hypothetical protein
VSSPCTSHEWTHSTESCPYCRETGTTSHHFGPVVPAQAVEGDARTERLSRAIVAAITGDAAQVEKLFTHDVVGSGPAISVTSRAELEGALEQRDGSLLDIEVQLSPLEVSGNQAAVEWVASAVPATSVAVAVDERRAGELAPTAERIRVRAVTVAEFEGDLISSFRSYWNEFPRVPGFRDTTTR